MLPLTKVEYSSSAIRVEASSTPPRIRSLWTISCSVFPGIARSGQWARKKSFLTFSPDFSRIGATTFSQAPGDTVDSTTTRLPLLRQGTMDSAADFT